MQKCKQCTVNFEITQEDKKFYSKLSISEPTLCPDCRQQRRLSFRNERTLYQRKCDLCKKDIISIYSSDKPFPVYCQTCFWSDQWDALDYGKDLDFQKDFFEQYKKLMLSTPRLAIINKQSENSEYCNYSFANKNCYLTFGNHYEEDCLYGHYSTKNKDCVDYLQLYKSELCYECNFSKNCYSSVYLDHCENSQNCYFSVDLKGCKNCLFSSNLRHKEYYIFNKPSTKEEYFRQLEAYQLNTEKGFSKAKAYYLDEFRTKFPFRSVYQSNCEHCDGNNNNNSKNLRSCFDTANSEDNAYSYQIDETYSSMDINCSGYDRCELDYQTIGCSGTFHCLFVDSCWHDSNLFYCNLTFSSQNCFGCIGLNQKKYCILNKQYSQGEYEKLVPQIIEYMKTRNEWGEFFPAAFSPFAYNETVAQEYFPLDKTTALARGYRWKDQEQKEYKAQTYKIPDRINDVPDSISNEILACCECGKNFRVIKQEIKFYKKMNIPVPRKCPDCRHQGRIKRRNPRRLWDRNCAKCGNKIQTTYSTDRPETVYCEKCYLKEIY